MANFIPRGTRRVIESETTRAIAATVVGEAIRRVGTTRKQAAEAASKARMPAAGGFAAGAGAATVALVGVRRIGRLIAKPKRPAAVGGSKPTGSGTKSSGASSGKKASRAKVAGASSVSSGRSRRTTSAQGKGRPKPTTSRGSSAKGSRSSNGSSRTSSAKSSRNSNGSSRSSSAKSTRSANGSRARSTGAKSAARPAASRRT